MSCASRRSSRRADRGSRSAKTHAEVAAFEMERRARPRADLGIEGGRSDAARSEAGGHRASPPPGDGGGRAAGRAGGRPAAVTRPGSRTSSPIPGSSASSAKAGGVVRETTGRWCSTMGPRPRQRPRGQGRHARVARSSWLNATGRGALAFAISPAPTSPRSTFAAWSLRLSVHRVGRSDGADLRGAEPDFARCWHAPDLAHADLSRCDKLQLANLSEANARPRQPSRRDRPHRRGTSSGRPVARPASSAPRSTRRRLSGKATLPDGFRGADGAANLLFHKMRPFGDCPARPGANRHGCIFIESQMVGSTSRGADPQGSTMVDTYRGRRRASTTPSCEARGPAPWGRSSLRRRLVRGREPSPQAFLRSRRTSRDGFPRLRLHGAPICSRRCSRLGLPGARDARGALFMAVEPHPGLTGSSGPT